MTDHGVKYIRAAFDAVKTELENLRASLHEINDALDTDRFVSSDMIGAMDEAVRRYREQASTLEGIGAELSIPIDGNITEIEQAIKLYEQKLNLQYLRSLVLDYFRLTAEVADVKMALEDSKRELAEKCAVDEAELLAAIEPYGIVVDHIRRGERRLPDERYDLVEAQIGKSIARATERGDLSIDKNYDISVYLDDSYSILASAREKDDEKAEDCKLPTPGIDGSIEDEVDMEAIESNTDGKPQNPEQSTLLPGYRGIAKEITVTIARNMPASSLKANEYKHLCKQKREVPIAMFWLGHENLRDESKQAGGAVNYCSPDSSIVDHLYLRGYVAFFVLESNLLTKRYLTLSEKGWACYRKQDVVKYLSSESLVVPAFLHSPAGT